MVSLILLISCQDKEPTVQNDTSEVIVEVEDSGDSATPEIEVVDRLTDIQLLTRISLDLRGIRPSVEELNRITDNSEELDTLMEEFLTHPRFGDRIRYMYDEIYHTDSRSFYASFESYVPNDSPFDQTRWIISLGEEPLRIVQQVIEADLPWTAVATADWTMANEHLATFYPVNYPEGETGWKQVEWTDERPAGGVFVTNGFHNRYISQGVNFQRRRANEVSRILLCDNYLGRPIEFSREEGISDLESTQHATQTKAACVACHISLDPLGSHFWGFQWHSYGIYDQFYYHPSKERMWEEFTGYPPSYYGQPSNGLTDLGHHIAADSRFSSCAVKQMMGFMFQEDMTIENTEQFNHHREVFLSSGMRMKSLIRSLIKDPQYTASFDNEEVSTARLMTDDMIRTSIHDLTGFRLRYDSIYGDQDILGIPAWRVIGGGLNDITVMSRSPYIHMPMTLLVEQLSTQAALYAAFTESDLPVEERDLFIHLDFTETPESHPDLFAIQIQHLLYRALGESVDTDSDRVNELIELWSLLYATQGEHWTVNDEDEQRISTWAGVLTAILRDPTFLIY